nr:hypothetical protein [Tanacetum cinerariifolium]
MTTLAEHITVAGAENRPLIQEKSMYDSWASRIQLFIKGKKNGRMMLDSIDEGPLVYPTVAEENGHTRPKKYSKLNEAQQLQDNYDIQSTNIILHGLPPYVYSFVNHQEATKDICDRVKLLMKGTELSYQEHSGSAIPTFQQGEDPINFINKVMEFPSAVASSGNKGISTTSRGNYAAGQPRVVNCQNCVGEGHMTRQCTRPKGPRNYVCFKEKFMLVKAQEVGQILDEKKLAFITDPGIKEALVAQQTIRLNSAFQTEDLDAYDSDCDDISLTKAVLMENLSSCDSDLLFKVPYFDTYPND